MLSGRRRVGLPSVFWSQVDGFETFTAVPTLSPTGTLPLITLMSSPTLWIAGRRVRAWIGIGLAIAGAVLMWSAATSPAPPHALTPEPDERSSASTSAGTSQPASRQSAAPARQPDLRDQVTGLALPTSDPVAVSIPRIGVHSRLVHLGLGPNGEMDVPRDPALAGWFSGGAAPGALGPAVIAGHVTWDGAPGVFHNLDTVRRGDRVTVTRKDGRTAVFTVSRVARFAKARFPSQAVYGVIDHAGLRLITCGGTYDAARHRYLDNVIVFGRLAAVQGPRH